MKRIVIWIGVGAMVVSMAGCKCGPLHRWLRGGACNACTPHTGAPACSSCGNTHQVFDDGATLGNPVFDAPHGDPYSSGPIGGGYGGTIVPPPSSEPLPGPQ